MIKQTIRLSDGTIWVTVIQSDEPPTPVEIPTTGVFVKLGNTYIYVVHDDLDLGFARTLVKQTISMTNEFFVPRRWYFNQNVQEWRVDRFSKISFWPEDLPYTWPTYFFSEMTEKQHALFNTSGFGWRDSKSNSIMKFIAKFLSRSLNRQILGVRPDGVNIYSFLLSGGTLLKKLGTWREYTLFACQDTNQPPTWTEYYDVPDKTGKQSVCGHNSLKESYYGKVNPNIGDLFIRTACPGGVAAILTRQTREVKVPIETILDGVIAVTFVELCVRGSEVLGKTSDGDWYYIVQQVRKNGGQSDFIVHIALKDWWGVLPISTVGWKKDSS